MKRYTGVRTVIVRQVCTVEVPDEEADAAELPDSFWGAHWKDAKIIDMTDGPHWDEIRPRGTAVAPVGPKE